MTSNTYTLVLEDERHHTLRDGLTRLCIQSRPLDGPPAIVRTKPALGFKALVNDRLLQLHRIILEIENPKNPNKNPVAEKTVHELEMELLAKNPSLAQLPKLLSQYLRPVSPTASAFADYFLGQCGVSATSFQIANSSCLTKI